jgi:hypothetical protein
MPPIGDSTNPSVNLSSSNVLALLLISNFLRILINATFNSSKANFIPCIKNIKIIFKILILQIFSLPMQFFGPIPNPSWVTGLRLISGENLNKKILVS